mmetsp:Transcript_44354/g.43034  ORF Transcript_44354/g.43034 Transcript_44354/m.43034 type:complete len:151 (-) Transcript_44354:346-798(-)
MIVLVLVAAGIDISIYKKYKVNYLFIFECDPNYRMTHIQLFRVALIMFYIILACFLCQVIILKLNFLFTSPLGLFSLILTILIIIICFIPIHVFYLKGRKALGLTLLNILVTPLMEVRFRHFFLADVITSFGTPLKDLTYMTCYFFFPYW